MSTTSDLAKGAIIRHQNDLYVARKIEFVSPGKGSAFSRVSMKSITTGKTIEVTYKSGETVDIVDVERRRMQYCYKTGSKFSFMNQESFEIFDVDGEILGDDAKFLKDGLEVMAILQAGSVVAVELPKKVQYKAVEAPEVVKGDTASGRIMKDVTLENGLPVRAPAFIRPGDILLINTETGEYCERVNE